MIGIMSFEKSSLDQRLDNYIIERQAIEKKLKRPTVPEEKKGRLKFRKAVIQRKAIQLIALHIRV